MLQTSDAQVPSHAVVIQMDFKQAIDVRTPKYKGVVRDRSGMYLAVTVHNISPAPLGGERYTSEVAIPDPVPQWTLQVKVVCTTLVPEVSVELMRSGFTGQHSLGVCTIPLDEHIRRLQAGPVDVRFPLVSSKSGRQAGILCVTLARLDDPTTPAVAMPSRLQDSRLSEPEQEPGRCDEASSSIAVQACERQEASEGPAGLDHVKDEKDEVAKVDVEAAKTSEVADDAVKEKVEEASGVESEGQVKMAVSIASSPSEGQRKMTVSSNFAENEGQPNRTFSSASAEGEGQAASPLPKKTSSFASSGTEERRRTGSIDSSGFEEQRKGTGNISPSGNGEQPRKRTVSISAPESSNDAVIESPLANLLDPPAQHAYEVHHGHEAKAGEDCGDGHHKEHLHPADGFNKDAMDAVIQYHNASCCMRCCAKQVFRHAEFRFDFLKRLVETYGEQEEGVDESFMDKEYSLRRGLYVTDEPKIEIEDTVDVQMQEVAMKHLNRIFRPILPTGVFMWMLIVGSGVAIGKATDCRSGDNPAIYAVLVVACAILYWQIDSMTRLLSKTTIEERPMVRIIMTGTGLGSHLAATGFAMLDLSGKFTRAMFVGHALHCSGDIDDTFANSFLNSPLKSIEPIIRSIGFGGLCLISFVIGPILFQGTFMFYNLCVVRWYFRRARKERMGNVNKSMGVCPCLDELAAIADWAELKPISKILGFAAIPTSLEDEVDFQRMWNRTLISCVTTLVNIIPDNVFQVCMMARFFALTFDATDDYSKAKLVFSMFCSTASAMKVAAELIAFDVRLTALAGVLLIFCFIEPTVRTVAAFYCEDTHIFSMTAMSCTVV